MSFLCIKLKFNEFSKVEVLCLILDTGYLCYPKQFVQSLFKILYNFEISIERNVTMKMLEHSAHQEKDLMKTDFITKATLPFLLCRLVVPVIMVFPLETLWGTARISTLTF